MYPEGEVGGPGSAYCLRRLRAASMSGYDCGDSDRLERSHPSPDRARPWRRLRLQAVARRVARTARRAAGGGALRQSPRRHGDRRRRSGMAARRRDLHRRDHRLLHADGRRSVRLRPHRRDQRPLRRLCDGWQADLRARGPRHADQQHADSHDPRNPARRRGNGRRRRESPLRAAIRSIRPSRSTASPSSASSRRRRSDAIRKLAQATR